MEHIDRNRLPLEIGQLIHIQQSAGIHRKTRILRGQIVKLYDAPSGANIFLEHDRMDRRSNGFPPGFAARKGRGSHLRDAAQGRSGDHRTPARRRQF